MASYYKYSANMNDRTYFTSVVTNSAGKDKRYFSNVESEIYFGDKEIDDIYQFQFSIDEKILPIYGYNCYYASELVSGQRLVQGQFVVNYTNGQLVKTILGEIEDSVYHTILEDKYHPGGGSILDPMYNKSFDIMIGYGYYNIQEKETYNATCQTIIGAKINGMQKVIDSTGQPIMEVYTFTAKDFIEENISEVTPGDSNEKDKDKDKNKNEKSPLAYVCSDMYNETEIALHEKLANDYENCLHFVHNLTLGADTITLQLEEGKGATLELKEGTLDIMEKLDESTIFPRFNLSNASKGIGSFKLEKKYLDIINKHKKENGAEYIKCYLTYTVTVTTEAKTKDYKVKYDTGYVYI